MPVQYCGFCLQVLDKSTKFIRKNRMLLGNEFGKVISSEL